MIGYKVLKNDGTSLHTDFEYKIGETYEMEAEPILMVQGFHFYRNILDAVFEAEKIGTFKCKLVEVEALGDTDLDSVKGCTNKIKISKDLTRSVLTIFELNY